MDTGTIAFIGGGNMARSIIGGLIADGLAPSLIHVADPDAGQRETLAATFAVHTSDAAEVISNADTVIFAVKPQVMKEVATTLAASIQQQKPLVISVAAGIRSRDLEQWLGGNIALVRSMPNTPALVQCGATGLFATSTCSDEQKARAEFIMRAVGLTLWFDDENMIDAVTALSGSGPAYFFFVIEAMEKAGVELGLDIRAARLLALQTAFGAAKMALESNDDPASLRERVTSKGGTTEAALAVLREGGLETLFAHALEAARDRSVELANLLGDK
jgi:pyrroline-5-carboxylate reductase